MEVDGEGLLGQETPTAGPRTSCIGGCFTNSFWSLSQPHLGFLKRRRLSVVIALLCKCCAESSLRDTGTQGHKVTGTQGQCSSPCSGTAPCWGASPKAQRHSPV